MVKGYFKVTKICLSSIMRERDSKRNLDKLSKTGGNIPFHDLLTKMQFSRAVLLND